MLQVLMGFFSSIIRTMEEFFSGHSNVERYHLRCQLLKAIVTQIANKQIRNTIMYLLFKILDFFAQDNEQVYLIECSVFSMLIFDTALLR